MSVWAVYCRSQPMLTSLPPAGAQIMLTVDCNGYNCNSAVMEAKFKVYSQFQQILMEFMLLKPCWIRHNSTSFLMILYTCIQYFIKIQYYNSYRVLILNSKSASIKNLHWQSLFYFLERGKGTLFESPQSKPFLLKRMLYKFSLVNDVCSHIFLDFILAKANVSITADKTAVYSVAMSPANKRKVYPMRIYNLMCSKQNLVYNFFAIFCRSKDLLL